MAKTLSPQRPKKRVFNLWTCQLLGKLDTLKFLAYIDRDGYPIIIPRNQSQPGGFEHLLFSAHVYGAELQQIRRGTPVAILGLALSTEDVLFGGEFLGLQGRAGILCGEVKIDWVYNSMPPAPGQIYPLLPLEVVQDFQPIVDKEQP